MKTKILTIVVSLATLCVFAQKKEIRNAEDAIEDGNYAQAKSLLKQAEPMIAEEKEKTQADFYLAKAQAYLGQKDGTKATANDLQVAAQAFMKAKQLGEEEAASKGILAVRNALVNGAIAKQNAQEYSTAADMLYQSYQLGKQDTIYLYYAASSAVTAKDYDNALNYYNQLMELDYDGAEMQYIATEKSTGKVKTFGSKKERDLFVQSGEYIKPEEKMSPSKTGEIAKNIALIYIEQGKPEMAKKAMERAKQENPDDTGLLQAEANMYYNMGDLEKYNQLMKEIVKKDPTNATMYYNLAVTSDQLGDQEGAVAYYKKAIQYDPEMGQAYINLAATILAKETGMLEKMNKALEEGDMTAYDKLSAERKSLYKQALPYLEKAHELNPQNVEAVRTMMNIYYVLENNTKAEEMKTKLDAMDK